MDKPIILQVALPTPIPRCFDYMPPNKIDVDLIQPGVRVEVPFGTRQLIGFVTNISNDTNVKRHQLKTAIQLIDQQPFLSKAFLKLAQWLSDYYHHPLGDTLATMVPKLLRQGYEFPIVDNFISSTISVKPSRISLTPAQALAVKAIEQHLTRFQTYLLYGITGSGKTEVYLKLIHSVLAQGKQVLVLIPEIGLTPQTLERFQHFFNIPITTIHSHKSEKERAFAWHSAKHGQAPLVIGTRSAVFTPFPNLGLIVVDEEHDLSFKQQSGLRYSARDTAVRRAQLENIPIILGSATPSLESYYNAEQKRYQLLTLNERVGNARLPTFTMIDCRKQPLRHGFSNTLLKYIQQHLTKKQQVLIFLNRRGYAPTLLCHECGWVAQCSRCDSRLTLHKHKQQLRCHHCGQQQSIPDICGECSQAKLLTLGTGTERLEQTLTEQFPNITITRIDRDTTRRKQAMQEKLTTIQQGVSQILIGTQMLAKGHHFPNVTLVAIIDVDSALFSTDFRASEQLAQLIVQVSGRAGRADKPGQVIIQTHQPEHPLLKNLVNHDYLQFMQQSLQERKQAHLPPYHYMALIRAEAVNTTAPLTFLQQVQKHLQSSTKNNVDSWGPVPAPRERLAGRYRYQLLLVSSQRKFLHRAIHEARQFMTENKSKRSVRWSIDVDPQDMS